MGKKIRNSHLEDWLLKQDVYTLYRTAPVHFKRNKILVHGIDKQFQADLVDMAELADQNDVLLYTEGMSCFISLNIHFLRERVKTFRYDISQNVTYWSGMTVFHLQPVHWSTTQTMLRWSKLSSGNFIQNRSRMGLS